MSNQYPLTVLLIDDDDVSCESVVRCFRKNNISFPVVTAGDGMEGLEILRHEHPNKRIDGPLVILLDLNMPRMNGFEFLQVIRNDPILASHVVFVLSTSNDDNDRTRAYAENIAGYMVKSAVGPQFSRVAKLMSTYGTSVTLPANHK